jgi:hypothetical protein
MSEQKSNSESCIVDTDTITVDDTAGITVPQCTNDAVPVPTGQMHILS